MKRYIFVIVGIAIAVFLIAFYAVHFYNAPLSDNTSDWGTLGSYIGIGVSILSVSLIYITNKEQQDINRIGRFEEHFYISLRTLIELFKKGKEDIELEDYSSEEFYDTYERLFNNKTKQE